MSELLFEGCISLPKQSQRLNREDVTRLVRLDGITVKNILSVIETTITSMPLGFKVSITVQVTPPPKEEDEEVKPDARML